MRHQLWPQVITLILATSNSWAVPSVSLAKDPPKVATAWLAGWHTKNATPTFSVADINWSQFTQLTYSFAETTPDVDQLSLTGSEPEVLPQFVSAAHLHGVKASVSIGGWTGSRFWSSNVGSAANRTAFVKTVVNFVKKYKLDALDFDWEYPGSQGIGCNVVSPSDPSNFLSFVQLLRADPVGAKLTLSAAVGLTPFAGASNAQIASFAKALDYIAVMNYDVWGPWSATVGPNAPLKDSCAPAAAQVGSAEDAVKAWSAAGMPKSQIVLGVPSYGHSFPVAHADAFDATGKLQLYPKFDSTQHPAGDSWDDQPGTDECGAVQFAGGVVDFWGLVSGGYLNKDGSVKNGVPFVFDDCSQTPFVYNNATQVMISFDNAQSFAAKGSFIKSQGLRGFAMWEAGGDPSNILTKAIRKAAGF